MSLENWGGMTKAQDDSTTVDEAIASAILAHEQDSESHMGAGESIENHRVNEIIDHPAGSIPFDKKKYDELRFVNYFTSPTDYECDGYVNQSGYGFIYLGYYHVANAHSQVDIPIPDFQNISFPEKPIDVQFVAKISWDTTADYARIMFGGDVDGFGFVLSNGVLKARLCINDIEYLSSAISINKGSKNVFRISISPVDNTACFILNGDVVAEIALHGKGEPDFSYLTLVATSTLTTYCSISISNIEMGYLLDVY